MGKKYEGLDRLMEHGEDAHEQLNRVLSIGSVGTWIWDVTGNVLTADKNLSRLFGVDPKKGATGLPLATFTDAIHPDDRDRIVKKIEEAVASEGSFEEEYRTIAADGQEYWVIARGKIEKDGRKVKFPGLLVDITERKVAEDIVRASQAKLKFMAEAMPQKIFTAEPNGDVDYFNPQWTKFSGMTFDQIKQQGWVKFIHPDDLEENLRLWNHSIATGEPFQIEHRFRRKDGEYCWHLSRARAMRDKSGNIVKWMGSNTDIHEQKRSEINLAFLARASKIFASSQDSERILKEVAELAVPEVADWCAIDLYEGNNIWKRVAIIHKDSEKIKLAEKLRKLSPPDIDAPTGLPNVIRTGQAEYYPVIDDSMLEASIQDKEHLNLLKKVGFTSAMVVPLKLKGKTIGAITFVSAEQKRHFTKTDLEMAEELASRASLSMTNVSLYDTAQQELTERRRLEVELRSANELLEQRVRERTLQLEVTNKGLQEQIEKRTETERTLFQEREFLRAVLGNVDAGIVTCDAKGILTYFNRATLEFHGLPRKPIAASDWAEYYNLYHADGETPMQQKDVPLFRALKGEHVENVEMIIVQKDGRRRTVLASGQIMTDEKGNKAGAVVAMQDITELKQTEKVLKEQTEELRRSNQELQDFAYVASHDLQEPLRKIQAFGNLLQDEYGTTLGEGEDYLSRMRGAASRMSTLIEDLLAFSRVTTQARPFSKVDLGMVAGEVASDLEVRLHDTKGTLKIGVLPVVDADPTQMRQLFQNLIGNALKFHKKNVSPIVKVSARKISAKKGMSASWRITVQDNGIGFEEKYNDRIFSVFQRLHGRDSYEGTGIGLAVCRKIVERHNGIIVAKSELDIGSTFIVTLPAEQQLSVSEEGEI